jgi:hypothetical protein
MFGKKENEKNVQKYTPKGRTEESVFDSTTSVRSYNGLIKIKVEELENDVDSLKETVLDLFEKLKPVISPDCSICFEELEKGEKEVIKVASGLLNDLSTLNAKVIEVRRVLDNISIHIEL